MQYDVVIVGGGPAGLSAALTLGRARKRVLLCDAGPPRNAAAKHINGFVTRDGVAPGEFRRVGQEQLAAYPSVETRATQVDGVEGEAGSFHVKLGDASVAARRIVLCTGMIDELPELEGFRALWGQAIFQCPYCHAWEVRDRRFGVLMASAEMLDFTPLLRGWTHDVLALTDGRFAVPDEARARLVQAGVVLEERPLARLVGGDASLERVEFTSGEARPLDVLFARPPQTQTRLVRALGLALDAGGYVQVDEQTRETSRPGIYAAGDLLTPAQGAIFAAASGMLAAAMLNHCLTVELALQGVLA
jgi:thioredoxin reductase